MITLIQSGETNNLASGYVRLKGDFFQHENLQMTRYQLAKSQEVSYQTKHKYFKQNDIRNFSGEVLYAILVQGMGICPAELEDMRFGDIFEVIEPKLLSRRTRKSAQELAGDSFRKAPQSLDHKTFSMLHCSF